MFTAGLGLIQDANVHKKKAQVNMKIAKIGGPTYKIGMNGGSASSRVSKQTNKFLDEINPIIDKSEELMTTNLSEEEKNILTNLLNKIAV